MLRPDLGPAIFRKPPTAAGVTAFIAAQRDRPLTYAADVSADPDAEPPRGYVVDEHRVSVGNGREAFLAAREMLLRWEQMPAAWMQIEVAPRPPRVGELVVTRARYAGLWWLNACRVVDVRDDGVETVNGREHRYEVAYGTLPGHVESGIETFAAVLEPDGRAWYEIRAVSRPQFWLAKFARRLSRRLQRRFAEDSLQQVAALVRERTTVPVRNLAGRAEAQVAAVGIKATA